MVPTRKVFLTALTFLALSGVTRGQIGREATCDPFDSDDCFFQNVATVPVTNANPNKRFIIGGIFDVHKRGASAYSCSTEMNTEGVLNLQAFLWAVNRFKSLYGNLNSISIGALAFDSCDRSEQNIENLLGYAQCKVQVQGLSHSEVVGYVGPYGNRDVEALSGLATDLSIPIVAPVANSQNLPYNGNEFLIKLSPSFGVDVQVMFALIRKLNVAYTILVYDENDAFWMSAYEELKSQLEASDTCVTFTAAYSEDAGKKSQLVDELERRQNVRYIVPLMSREMIGSLMDAIKSRNSIAANSFRFVLNSDLGQDIGFMASKSATANNTLIVERAVSDASMNQFGEFAQALANSPSGQVGAVNASWITEYYAANGAPKLDASTPSKTRYSIAKTLDAVQGIMRAMSNAVAECGESQICDKYRNKGRVVLDQISQVLRGAAPQNPQVGAQFYNVVHFFVPQSNTGPQFRTIGAINVTSNGVATASNSLANLLNTNAYGVQFSDSSCTSDSNCCAPDTTTAAPTTETPAPSQGSGSTVDPNQSKMVAVFYPVDQEITGAYFDADRNSGEYGTRFDLDHKWIIALGVLAGLGIVSVVIFEIYLLYKLLGTRVGNKWRTMWLGQLLLFGVLLCYLTLFAYIPIPTKATCGITRFGVGVSYSICFAVLLVKLMVILTSRSSSDVLLPGDMESPNYLKGIYQFLMFIFAVGVQVVINIQWLITIPPEAVPVIANNGERVWVCNHYTWEAGQEMDRMDGWVRSNFENHLLSLCYIMVMILITTLLSLNAHGIITNHRESIFIGISAGFSIPIWLAWGLVGGLNNDHAHAHEFGDACIAFGLFLTATLILFAMFLPKVRQLVNMGVEGIYLEDDRDTYYAGSVIMAPPSYKSGKGPNSVIYVNNQGIYSEPVVIGNGGDPSKNNNAATHLRHPGSVYSLPPTFVKKADSTYGGSNVLRVTNDLKGRHPQKPRSEAGYPTGPRTRSHRGTLPRSKSQSNLGAL